MGSPARQLSDGDDLGRRSRPHDPARAWRRARSRVPDVREQSAGTVRTVVSERSRGETCIILQTTVALLVILITIVAAVVTLSWFSPVPVARIGSDRPVSVPPPAACCDVAP